mmetsp:Transcript_91143/g.126558  ORF Transcript_91143/g.126558 Transcript_91143/m.126558 type:complete len:230 (+) Transcript_91143:272-961(+)
MEYCENGSLATIVKKTGPLEESLARFVFTQIASAVHFLHEKQFAHLDVKLENILLDKWFNIKLADFGSGVNVTNTRGLTNNKIGTPLYMPPEIKHLKKGEYYEGLKADIYSLGVTLCLLLFGEIPDFSEFRSQASTMESNEFTDSYDFSGDVEMGDQMETTTDFQCKSKTTPIQDLLVSMMSEDPKERPTIQEVFSHEWMYSQSIDGLQEDVYSELKARMDAISEGLTF